MATSAPVRLPYLPEEAMAITYDDGYQLIFVPKAGGVFTISTWVKTGSLNENDVNNGVSHFLEHLMFKGTDKATPGEFDRKMEAMGAVINAATWKDFTFYYITGPNFGDNFDTALSMHADMLLHSTLPESEVGPVYNPDDADYAGEKRERSVVIEEIGMREDQPWTKVYNAVNHMMYEAGHPYQRDVIGSRQIIGNIPRESIQDYYHTWYTPSTMTTIVVGDFNFARLEPQVRQAFQFVADKHPPQVSYPATKMDLPGQRYVELTGNYQTSFFIVGFHGPQPNNLLETIALDVFSYILGEGRSSRLTQALIERPATPVFNMASTGQSTFKLGNVFFIQGNFNSTDTKQCLGQVQAELETLLADLSDDEFERACKKLRVEFAETSETSSGIAETIGESITIAGDLSLYTNYLACLDQLDKNTVLKTARAYLNPNKAYTAVLAGQPI